jgi:uncharacterized protein (TIGR03663 family)
MILLFAAGATQFGWMTATLAALFFAVGPMPVYYSRYFIHETLFVAATLGLILSGTRLLATRLVEPGVAAGFYAGIMLASKETALLHFAAFGIAAVAGHFMFRRTAQEASLSDFTRPLTLGPGITGALVAFTAMVVVSYSWGCTNWKGLTDLFHAVPHLAARASGQGHEKPASYYFTLLSGGKSGAVILGLALLGVLGVLLRVRQKQARVIPDAQYPPPSPLADPPDLTLSQTKPEKETGLEKPGERASRSTAPAGFQSRVSHAEEIGKTSASDIEYVLPEERKTFAMLLIYTVAIAALYSLIPYKTPWLALNLWLPLTLLAGFGCTLLWRICRPPALRVLLVAGLCAVVGALGYDTWDRAFAKSSDERNPYAYAHTSEGLLHLPERIAELAPQIQSRSGLRITVVAADPWPLPWYLRKFPLTGYWQPGQKEPGPADIYITSTEAGERLGDRLKGWRPEYFESRPGVLVVLWTPPGKESAP